MWEIWFIHDLKPMLHRTQFMPLHATLFAVYVKPNKFPASSRWGALAAYVSIIVAVDLVAGVVARLFIFHKQTKHLPFRVYCRRTLSFRHRLTHLNRAFLCLTGSYMIENRERSILFIVKNEFSRFIYRFTTTKTVYALQFVTDLFSAWELYISFHSRSIELGWIL